MLALPFLVPWHRLPVASFESEALAFLLGTLACLFGLRGLGSTGVALTRAQPVALPRIASAALALMAIVLWLCRLLFAADSHAFTVASNAADGAAGGGPVFIRLAQQRVVSGLDWAVVLARVPPDGSGRFLGG